MACAWLAACASAPPREIAAADSASRTAATGYTPVLTGYTAGRPVAPRAWREQNEMVAPKEKKP
jgi:hypothetical protein